MGRNIEQSKRIERYNAGGYNAEANSMDSMDAFFTVAWKRQRSLGNKKLYQSRDSFVSGPNIVLHHYHKQNKAIIQRERGIVVLNDLKEYYASNIQKYTNTRHRL
ncbi:hypothetical protein BDEG_27372 [Batrachochytrium dendrobatidis JEL423]|uniref:Uncharacterized protein n=1 Tax=Batrachochytrium dendrobatidis (strain JEL423) TaxID=403673 RepID=A0A177WX73_BATDL|nr:hypothetical protein BDEG_27372 [Batrachochytrium dendrobatidis JEL423]